MGLKYPPVKKDPPHRALVYLSAAPTWTTHPLYPGLLHKDEAVLWVQLLLDHNREALKDRSQLSGSVV